MDSVPYDTAWVARLAPRFPGYGFEQALTWLRQHQRVDGSWGGGVLHYHDRVICTLASIVALKQAGDATDWRRIKRGEGFLWRNHEYLHRDAHDTIAYSVLASMLLSDARAADLDVPSELHFSAATIEKKLNLLSQNPHLWSSTTMLFSLEAVFPLLPQMPDDLDIVESDGSVGFSPAATAATILKSNSVDPRSLDYLQQAIRDQDDGGLPFAKPFDIFESAWTLNHLRLANAVSPDQPETRRILDFLYQSWSPEHGISFSPGFDVSDLDDTAVTFAVLHWGGYPVDNGVFAAYEEPTHFRCYPYEADLSLSVNIRTLGALIMGNQHLRSEPWMEKILAMLRHHSLQGEPWFDKWHVSSYYLASTMIMMFYRLQGVRDLLQPRVRWLLSTQRKDGGWGFSGHTTAEETAYCLQALLCWDRAISRVDQSVLDRAARYLFQHVDDRRFPPLWIGKCLYMPRQIVRSALYMALHSYITQ